MHARVGENLAAVLKIGKPWTAISACNSIPQQERSHGVPQALNNSTSASM